MGAGLAKPDSSSVPVASTSSAPSAKDRKPANPFANYSTAESLGYTDPDAERLKVEAERRRTEGVAGEWEVVAESESEPPLASAEQEQKPTISASQDAGEGSVSRKREAQEIIDQEDGRQWKLRKKTLGVGLGEIYDPGVIQVKVKPKKEESSETVPQKQSAIQSSIVGPSGSAATTMPKWSSRGWNKPGAENMDTDHTKLPSEEGPSESSKDDSPYVKQETESSPPTALLPDTNKETAPVKLEEDAPPQNSVSNAGSGLFRKRKVPAGGAGSRGTRF